MNDKESAVEAYQRKYSEMKREADQSLEIFKKNLESSQKFTIEKIQSELEQRKTTLAVRTQVLCN